MFTCKYISFDCPRPLPPPLWRQPRAASMGGCLEARQAGNPRVENDFPPGKRVSHHGKSCPTVPPPLLTLHFRPYLHFPKMLEQLKNVTICRGMLEPRATLNTIIVLACHTSRYVMFL